MTPYQLQSWANDTLPIPVEQICGVYNALDLATKERTIEAFKLLAKSHERLRMELEEAKQTARFYGRRFTDESRMPN